MKTPDLEDIYKNRFTDREPYRQKIWKVLVEQFFSRWTPQKGTILDLGCGYGEFINQVKATRKFGMDLNPSTKNLLSPDIEFLQQDCSQTWQVADNELDMVFTSNFFEHLPDKDCLTRCLREALRSLKPGGRLIAMGPNIAAINGRYWDFYDHFLPLTDLSLSEGMRLVGFNVETAHARFLPYTMVGAPQYPLWTLKLYLKCPFLWKWFGGQFLVIATKPE